MEQSLIKQEPNPAKEKILLISQKTGLVWSEIAKVTGINKKVIKAIAKDEMIPGKEMSDQLCKMLDSTIERLSIDPCLEDDLDGEDFQFYKLDVKSVTIYKGTDDDKMIIQIHGIIMK